jgi:hypothetical protein
MSVVGLHTAEMMVAARTLYERRLHPPARPAVPGSPVQHLHAATVTT